MTTRQFTQELLKAQRKGMVVVASLLPADGLRVEYRPRRKFDPAPWTRTDRHGCVALQRP